jgi:hypothetical protein
MQPILRTLLRKTGIFTQRIRLSKDDAKLKLAHLSLDPIIQEPQAASQWP